MAITLKTTPAEIDGMRVSMSAFASSMLTFMVYAVSALLLAVQLASGQTSPRLIRLTFGRWEPCIVEGDASQRIIELEQELDCDLVVIGKHGRSATEDLLLGSTTKHVLAEGATDVLVATAASLH